MKPRLSNIALLIFDSMKRNKFRAKGNQLDKFRFYVIKGIQNWPAHDFQYKWDKIAKPSYHKQVSLNQFRSYSNLWNTYMYNENDCKPNDFNAFWQILSVILSFLFPSNVLILIPDGRCTAITFFPILHLINLSLCLLFLSLSVLKN